MALAAALLVAATLGAPVVAWGQSCYTSPSPQYFYDLCSTTALSQQYEYQSATSSYFVSSGTNYLMACLKNDLTVYDAGNPLALTKLVALHIPWDWTTIDVLGSTHEQYGTHIRDIATLPGFGYGLVAMADYGWDFLKLNGRSTQFLGHGYHPAAKISGGAYDRAALFQNGTTVYAAAQMLDQASINDFNNYVGVPTVRIYAIGGSTPLGAINTDNLTPVNIGPGAVVPAGRPTDAAGFRDTDFPLALGVKSWVMTTGGRRLLLARTQTLSYRALLIADITYPTAPVPLLVVNNQTEPGKTLLSGTWAVDEARSLIWVGDPKVSNVYGFKIDASNVPAAPPTVTLQTTVNWRGGTSPQALGVTSVAVSGDLLTAWTVGKIGYVGLSATGAANLLTTPSVPFTDLDSTRVCLNSGFAEGVNDVKPFAVGGAYFACRSLGVDADIVAISGSCMSTTPAPAFTVAATTAGLPTAATCAGSFSAPSTSVAAVGFPGDTFAIADASTGTIASGTVAITPATGAVQNWSETGANAWLPQPLEWVSPATSAPGEYQVAMTLQDASGASFPLTKSIYLCSTPKAHVQITAVNGTACSGAGCVYLANDKVTFSAAPGVSDGTPTSWTWYQDGSVWPSCTGATCDWYVPSSGGPYTVAVAAVYGFPGSVDSSCANLTVTNNGDWASCAANPPITPTSFTVGDVSASQTGSLYPNFVTSQPITVTATYAVASGFTANFIWALDGVSGVPSATPASQAGHFTGTVTGTITAPAAGSHTVALAASATDGTNVVTPSPAPQPVSFNVTTCSNGAPTTPYPTNGAVVTPGNITLTWSPAPGSIPAPTYSVKWGLGYLPSCTGITATSCTVAASAGGAIYNWSVTASNLCGNATSPTWSFTTSGVAPTATPTPTPTPPPGGRLTITPSPNPASAGQAVQFSFSPALSASNDALTFSFGAGETPATVSYPACSMFAGACSSIAHTYNPSATTMYTVSASGIAGGAAVSGSTTVTVQVVCMAAAAPVAAFTAAPVSLKVQFADASSGVPTSWAWNFGDAGGPFPAGTSSAQNPLYTFKAGGTYTVTLTASNCKGSSQSQQRITVSSCSQAAAPAANFTWGPTGALSGFPEQQQPYAGQQITLTDASTGSPTSWHWYDFNELAMNQTIATPAFTFTWPANLPAGPKNVRMTATNCVGTSAEVAKTVTIYPDVRHVVADFSWSSGTLSTGAPVTLTAAQGPANGDPDTFNWTFDDGGTPQNGASITHTFTCAGTHTVTLSASRSASPSVASATAAHALTVTGQQCGPDSVMTVDAAQLNGLNGTSWLTNVRIFNPSSQTSQITVQFLPIGYNNSSPSSVTVPVLPKATLVLDNVVQWGQKNGAIGADVKKAALRIVYDNPENVAPILVSETYNSPSTGGTYGQLTPGIAVVPNTTPPVLWIGGIRNNGPTTGFRTNYSLLNLRDSGVSNVQFTLLDPTGKSLATQSLNLGAFEYRQDSLANLFGGTSAATSPDPLAVKVVVPADSDVQAYASVVDNLTGDPVLVAAVPPPSASIFLPAVAYTPGVNGTVWRSDMQLTNPDSAPHTWAVTYTPSGHDTLPIATQKPTVAAQSSVRYDDLLSWLYGGTLTDVTKTSGVIEITPADGSGVYPIVQARSFNQTASGTFGQNIPPITPDMGVAAGQGKRLLLTGMSSQDIARTNVGFVNLSDTSSVNFAVTFYDENGNLLNPKDGQGNPVPYTFSLGVGGWDQDKLENRFHNAGWAALPSNLHAISAVIQVTDGGPGTVYATVIDNLTGDPNFILAQPAP